MALVSDLSAVGCGSCTPTGSQPVGQYLLAVYRAQGCYTGPSSYTSTHDRPINESKLLGGKE